MALLKCENDQNKVIYVTLGSREELLKVGLKVKIALFTFSKLQLDRKLSKHL